jgi:uncharacterized protein with von Willebrand factor type A (vWA) domain
MNTIILILLDESGSMSASKEEVINAVNKFIGEQKIHKDDNAKLYFLTFCTYVNVLFEDIPLEDFGLIKENFYKPHGFTALYDAIAEGVELVEKNKKSDDRVVCLIITDGKENSSIKTTLTDVRNLIMKHEANNDWTFVYIGKNPDSWKSISGTNSNNSINYDTPDSINLSSHPILSFRQSQQTSTNDLFK